MEATLEKRAVIYTRVSTQSQVEMFGLDVQRDKCQKMIEMKGWTLTRRYEDQGISGTLGRDGRPGLNELLEDAKAGKFDCVVFYALDRIARKVILVLQLIDEFDKLGIEMISCKESIDTSTPMGKFLISVMAGLVELERNTIVQRMKDGKEERRKKDGNTGGRLPYGYTRDENKNIVINQMEALGIRMIFDLKAELNDKGKKKYTLQEICNILEGKKINPPRSKGKEAKWHQGTVHRILKRKETYEGGLIYENENDVRWPKII